MSSPILLKQFEEFSLDHSAAQPVYLQLANAILALIKCGKLNAGQKLPSTRNIASILNVNRITVIKATADLEMQGWLTSAVGRGTFVADYIKDQELLNSGSKSAKFLMESGFDIPQMPYLSSVPLLKIPELHLDDGYPDPRLAPLKELYQSYRSQLTRSGLYHKFGSYADPAGSINYRVAISNYLNGARGFNTKAENIFSIRGTLMGINLVCNALIAPGDVVVSGVPGWRRFEHNILHSKARHIGIPVDENGLVVERLREICKKQRVRMVYVTPHHHYPTTVSLRMDRRLELLQLAAEYGFIILEDDYDFDFHYKHRPLLPLASMDENGMVIYCGSFSKSFSPAFRIGYLVAAENVITHLAKVRVLNDRQGDHIMDNAMADIISDGTIQRYLRKALPVYAHRRDLFCKLMNEELNGVVSFKVPDGGMSVWAVFDKSIDLNTLSEKAYRKGLLLSDGDINVYPDLNALRLGFASSSDDELIRSVELMKSILMSPLV